MNNCDVVWMLLSSALVFFMIPGLALFYGGMVRSKNVLSTIMQSFTIIGLITLQWIFVGYSLAFSHSYGSLIGGLEWFGLRGVGLEPHSVYAPTVPHLAFMIFQCMFAIITPALITGAFAERMKFSSFLLFVLLWSTCVYAPIAHWVWNSDGWLFRLGNLDFAGGTVVHISSGVSALVMAILLGKRKEVGKPHNLTMTMLGTAMLWFGWFGFNAGSALTAGKLSVNAFVVTHIAAATAALTWLLIEWALKGKPTILGKASGAVAGLVAITPAAGFVSPMSAVCIGIGASFVCYWAIQLKNRLGFDDSLDVWGIHGMGGTWGALATGIFAQKEIGGVNGLLFGNPHQLLIQGVGVATAWIFAALGTFLIFKILEAFMTMRVTTNQEEEGLDESLHGEIGYIFHLRKGEA